MSLNYNNPKRIKLNRLEIGTVFRQLVEFVEQSLVFNGKSSIGSSKIGQLISLDELVNSNLIIEPLISLNCDIETFIWNIVSNYADNLDLTILSEIRWKCESIIDWCWQLINRGKWTEVSIELRRFYAYHHQLKAILLLLSLVVGDEESTTTTKDNPILQTLIDALQSIDQGLIMSPDFPGSILSKSASFLNQTIVHQLKHPSNNIIETDNKIFDQWNRLLKQLTSVTNLPLPKPNDLSQACQQIPKIELLDFFQFQHHYFESRTPVIITGATKDWPCLGGPRKWTLQYLLEKAAFRRVPIEIGSKYTDDEWSQRVMSFIDFVEQFIVVDQTPLETNQIGYLAQHNLFEQITDLADDFSIPDYCGAIDPSTDDNCDDNSVDINGWFGPAGTVSPLHTDPKHNIFAQIMGQKYIRLYSDQTPADQIYPHHDSILLGNTSCVDLESNEQRTKELYPKFTNIDPKLIYECLLSEGELLFIPKLYWHFVKSLSTSFSISFWW